MTPEEEIAALRAELEHLHEYRKDSELAIQQVMLKDREISRLRAALEKIAEIDVVDSAWVLTRFQCEQIARAALSGERKDNDIVLSFGDSANAPLSVVENEKAQSDIISLRAEIDRLKKAFPFHEWRRQKEEAQAEISRLRAALEKAEGRLRDADLWDWHCELEDSKEQLAEANKTIRHADEKFDAVCSERTRLRAALEKIENSAIIPDCEQSAWIWEIARAALDGDKPEPKDRYETEYDDPPITGDEDK